MTAHEMYFKKRLQWKPTESAEFPFCLTINGDNWQIKLNDFPEEALYTLVINNIQIVSFDDWPVNWER